MPPMRGICKSDSVISTIDIDTIHFEHTKMWHYRITLIFAALSCLAFIIITDYRERQLVAVAKRLADATQHADQQLEKFKTLIKNDSCYTGACSFYHPYRHLWYIYISHRRDLQMVYVNTNEQLEYVNSFDFDKIDQNYQEYMPDNYIDFLESLKRVHYHYDLDLEVHKMDQWDQTYRAPEILVPKFSSPQHNQADYFTIGWDSVDDEDLSPYQNTEIVYSVNYFNEVDDDWNGDWNDELDYFGNPYPSHIPTIPSKEEIRRIEREEIEKLKGDCKSCILVPVPQDPAF